MQFLDELKSLQDNGVIDIATYTAATQDYADDVLSVIDPQGIIKYRFYRHDCSFDYQNKTFVKDLRKVYREIKRTDEENADESSSNLSYQSSSDENEESELKRVIMLDDSPSTYRNFKNNTINIRPWRNDNNRDHVLKDCLAILK